MAERLVVRNSTFKVGLLLLFSVVALVLVIGGEAFGVIPKPGSAWLRWPAVFIFGAIAALLVRDLRDRRPQIVVDRNGILTRHWSEQIIPWAAIKSCRVEREPLLGGFLAYKRHICLYLHDRSRYPRTTLQGLPFGRGWNLGHGDIMMRTVGLDRDVSELIAAIRKHAVPAGVEVTE